MHPNLNSTVSDESPQINSGPLIDQELVLPFLFQEEDSLVLATSPGQKPGSFYVSLFLNGHKLSNYIIDSGASNNVMPSSVGCTLKLTLTKKFIYCYSMDAI